MINFLKKKVFRIVESLSGPKGRAKLYRYYHDISIGKNARFTGKPNWGTESFLIKIGDNVTITQDVTFITHDGGVGIFRKEIKGINVFGRIVVGNNVFIGARSMLLPGVTIGNDVVIAAGSIVTKDIPNNSVAAGIPAKVIKTIEEYKDKIIANAIFIEGTNPESRKKEILSKLK